MKKRILKNLGAGASNKAVALGFVALVSAGGAFAGYSNYIASSSNGIAAVTAEEDPVTEADKKAKEAVEKAIYDIDAVIGDVQQKINSTYFEAGAGVKRSVWEAFQSICNKYGEKINETKIKFASTAENQFEENEQELTNMLPKTEEINSLINKAEEAYSVFVDMKFESFGVEIENAKSYVDNYKNRITQWASDTAYVGDTFKIGQLQNIIENYRLAVVNGYIDGLGTLDTDIQADIQSKVDNVGYCTYTKSVTDNKGNVTIPETWEFSDATTLLGRFKQRFVDEETALIETNKLDSCFNKIDEDVALMSSTWKATNEYTTNKAKLDQAKKSLTNLENEINAKEKGIETYESQLGNWNSSITSISSDWEVAWSAINKIVAKSFREDIEKVQKTLNDYNNEIAAKYGSEPDVQNEYKEKFAVIQKTLDKISSDVEDWNTATSLVGQNKDIEKRIETVKTEIEAQYEKAGLAQNEAIKTANDETWSKFNAGIEDLNKKYLEHIQRMGEYEEIAELAKDENVKNEIVNTRNLLFPFRGTIDNLFAENEKKYGEAGNTTYYEYDKAEITTISADMQALRDKACKTINNVAYKIMFTNYPIDDNKGEFDQRKSDIEEAKTEYPAATYKWVNDSIVKLYNRYFDVKAGDNNETAFELLTKYNNEEVVADHMSELKEMLKKLDEDLAKIITEGEAQKKVYNGDENIDGKEIGLYTLQAEWTKAWGNKDADGSEEALTETYKKIESLEADFKEKSDKGEVSGNEDYFFTQLNDLYNEIYKYVDADGYKANEDAYAELNATIEEITKAIAETRTAIEGYDESVQNEYMPKTDDVETALETLKAKVEEYYTNRTLANNKTGVGNEAASLKSLIKAIADAAAEAQNETSVVEGDANGDGKIDASDLEIVLGCIGGVITDEETKAKADVNGDGNVTSADVRFIKNKMAE